MAWTVKQPTYDLIPEGYYDAIILRVGLTYTAGGTEYIAVDLLLDSGRQTTLPIWQIKNNPSPADIELGGWSARTVMALSKAAGMEPGQTYEGMEDWGRALVGKQINVYIKHETYKGRTSERVQSTMLPEGKDMTEAWQRYQQRMTRQPAAAPAPARTATSLQPGVPAGFQPVDDDDDLPF